MTGDDMKHLTEPARDMTCESSSLELRESYVRRKDASRIALLVASISINLVAVGLLSYALYVISQNSNKPHTYSVVERGNNDNDFTPLQMMAVVDINKVPTDANVLLNIKDKNALTMRLYQIKGVQSKLDDNKQELQRTFYLSMGHTLTFKKGSSTAILYDESGSNLLAEYELNVKNDIKLAEMEDAREVKGSNEKSKTLRRLFFMKDKSSHMKPYGPPSVYGPRPPYGYNQYCPYCGMYSYGNRGGFPFGGGYGYPYGGGFGGGMGGFGLF